MEEQRIMEESKEDDDYDDIMPYDSSSQVDFTEFSGYLLDILQVIDPLPPPQQLPLTEMASIHRDIYESLIATYEEDDNNMSEDSQIPTVEISLRDIMCGEQDIGELVYNFCNNDMSLFNE